MSFVTNGQLQEQQVIVKMGNETSQPVGGEDQGHQNVNERREMSFDELRQLAAAGERQSPTAATAPNSMQAASTVLMASPTQATGTIPSTAANTHSPSQRLNGVVVNGDAKLNASIVTPTAIMNEEASMKIGEQIDEAIAEIKILSPSSSPAAVEFRISVSAETVAVPEAPAESQPATGKSTPINVQSPTAAVKTTESPALGAKSPSLAAKSPTTAFESPEKTSDLQRQATVSPKSPSVSVASAELPAEAAAVSKTAYAVSPAAANKSPEQSIVPSEAPSVAAPTSEVLAVTDSLKGSVEISKVEAKLPAVVAKSPTNSTVSNETTAVASATAETRSEEAKLQAIAVESPPIAAKAVESQTVSTESTAVSAKSPATYVETPATVKAETVDEVASSDAQHIERSPEVKATDDEPKVDNKETLPANSMKLNSPELASQPPKNAKIPIKIQVKPAANGSTNNAKESEAKSESKKAKKSKAPKQVESTSSTTSSNGNEAMSSNATSIANEPQSQPQSQANKGAIPKVPKQVESTSSTTSSQPNESQPSEPILYLNPITLEADYFLKTINDNAENFSVLDPQLVDALETIMETINALLQRNQDRFIVETERVKFVPKAEMRLLKRSFICSLCKEYVGNTSEKATAHLANCHVMEPKRKSKKQLKREKEEEKQKKKEKKKEAKEKKAAAKEKEKEKEESRSVSNSSASISKTTNEEDGAATASTSKAAKTKQEKSAEVKAKEQAMLTNSKSKDEAQKQKQPSTGTQTQKPNQPSAGTQTQKPNQPSAGTQTLKPIQPSAETQTLKQNKLEAQTQTNQAEGATKKKRERNKKQPGEAKHVSQQLPKKARALFSNNMQQFFVDHVQLATTLKHIPAYDRIEIELMELLQKVFPNQTVKLFKFGSRISGVGTRDSDLDIYVDIDNNFINFENRPSSKTLSHISMVYSALMKTNQRWKHIVQIKNARVPILKVLNCSTSIECDIGFSNSLGYCNTKLVEYLLNLQPVARCLCIFLKKWLDRSKLSSVTSYSMTLMVIFYLQVNKLLPSVQSVQIGLTKKLYVGPWLGNFVEKTLEQWGLEEVQMSTQSVKLLLKNFFEFYLKFPYDKCVICPYLANLNIGIGEISHIMPKRYADFVQGPVGREYPLEVDKKSIIVQDPLQLNHNVTKNITKLQLTLLKDYMEHSLRLFEEMR